MRDVFVRLQTIISEDFVCYDVGAMFACLHIGFRLDAHSTTLSGVVLLDEKIFFIFYVIISRKCICDTGRVYDI